MALQTAPAGDDHGSDPNGLMKICRLQRRAANKRAGSHLVDVEN